LKLLALWTFSWSKRFAFCCRFKPSIIDCKVMVAQTQIHPFYSLCFRARESPTGELGILWLAFVIFFATCARLSWDNINLVHNMLLFLLSSPKLLDFTSFTQVQSASDDWIFLSMKMSRRNRFFHVEFNI
jgi:hypothetical protein